MLKHFLWIVPAVLAVRTAMAAASPLAGCTEADYATGKVFYDRITAAYKDGTISLLDYKSAETAFLDVELCAGKIDHATYCTQMSATLDKMLDIFKKAETTGLRGGGDSPFSTLKQLTALRTNCQ